MTKGKLIILFLSFFILSASQAQTYYIVKGQIFDKADKLTLPQAHVIIDGEKGGGTVADMDGNYQLATTQKSITLIFRYMGYKELKQTVTFKGKDPITLNIGLESSDQGLAGVEVVSSRYEVEQRKNIQSMEVVGLKQIDRTNATTLDRALDNVSGLTIVDNEPQMRGGSGFSSGMGSRVMILLDEMPILRADAGRPAWNLIPMEDVSQIEIIKGASSVMYGSAAINGAINVRTAFAKNDPETKAKIYAGFYSKPQKKELAQWDKDYPLLFGASLSHARKWNKFDFTFAAEYAGDDGYRGNDQAADARPPVPIVKEVIPAERRVRASIGTQYRPNNYWVVGLNANFLYSNNYQHHFWYNAEDHLYRAYPGTLSHFNDIMLFIDPTVKYISPLGGVHTLKNRILMSDNQVLNLNNQNAASTTVYNEYQYRKTFKKAADLALQTGISNQYASSYGTVFAGNDQTIGTARSHFANNLAVFAKLEKSFFKQKNLSLTLGARLESATIDTFMEVEPVFQFGVNFHIPKSHTYFRASIGQGYRPATIGERYITTTVGNYGFFANPTLESERSVNTELAVKQMFRIGKSGAFEGFIDIAGFYQTYDNYIEFCMGPWRNTTNVMEKFGFKFFNTGPAVIRGFETTVAGQGKFGQIFEYQLQMGYTYSLPQAVDPNYVYVRTFNIDYTYQNSAYETENRILKYRIQHVAKFDLNLKFINRITLGYSAQYFSQMANVDRIFMDMDKHSPFSGSWLQYMGDLPFQGMYNFMEDHKDGAWVMGLRLGWEAPRFTAQVILENFLNAEYALRPLCIEAPRRVTIQLLYKFVDSNPPQLFKRRSKANA